MQSNYPQHTLQTQAGRDAAEALSEARQAKGAIAQTAEQLERLSLVCQAIWSLLEEETSLTQDDLRTRLAEIDLRDGIIDGRFRNPLRDCKKCGAKVPHGHDKCGFCGEGCEERLVFS
jgi:hypothetical protein